MSDVLQHVVGRRPFAARPSARVLLVVVLALGLALAQPAQAAESTTTSVVRSTAVDHGSDGPGAAGVVVGVTLLLGWAATGALLLRQGQRRLRTRAADAHVLDAAEPR